MVGQRYFVAPDYGSTSVEEGATMTPVRIDMPVQAGIGGTIAGRVFTPDLEAAASLAAPVWAVLAPGATEDWHYWDMRAAGVEGNWSYAEALAARGIGAVLVDTYGVGDSVYQGHGSDLSTEVLALAHHQAATQIRGRLRSGELAAGVAAVDPVLVGMGHSGGGGLTVCMQGQHATYDLVVSFGLPASEFGGYEGGADEVRTLLTLNDQGYYDLALSEASMEVSFTADVPEALLKAQEGYVRAIPPGLPQLMQPGVVAKAAAQIEVPVFLCFGEIDLAKNPLAEFDHFTGTKDVTVHVQAGARHCPQISPVRHQLAETVFTWIYGRTRYGAAARHGK